MKKIAYTLILTREETDSVYFVGYRYAWSEALWQALAFDDEGKPDPIRMTENEAWNIRDAFEQDTEGGHSFFPMLDPDSELAKKLHEFMEGIV